MVVEVQAETVIINKAEYNINGANLRAVLDEIDEIENRRYTGRYISYCDKGGCVVKTFIRPYRYRLRLSTRVGTLRVLFAERKGRYEYRRVGPRGKGRLRLLVGGPRYISFSPTSGNIIIVTNRGSIDTSRGGGRGHGIWAEDRNIVTNRGAITTSGGHGIWAEDRNIVTNRGHINTKGDIRTNTADGINVSDWNTVTNSGFINTEGVAVGIFARDNNTVTNSGRITTKGSIANGISALNNNTVTNRGAITTTGKGASGIEVWDHNTVTNRGAINTKGEGAHGIRAHDDNPLIINETGATLNTEGHVASGIWARDRNKITNRGLITTAGDADSNGDGGHGVQARTHNTIYNERSARIHTKGANAAGIRAGVSLREARGLYTANANAAVVSFSLTGGHNTIRNDGNIQTTGANAAGIQVTGKGNHVTNTGRIHTTGQGAAGLLAVNVNTQSPFLVETKGAPVRGKLTLQTDNTRLFNSGSINTTGAQAPGIRVSDNSNVTNSVFGSINTEGEGAHGILARDNNTVINSGAINTEGNFAGGILAYDNNTVTNSGAINTEGDLAGGILVGDNNTITNSGAINIKGDSFVFGIQAGDNNTITNRGAIKIKGIGRNFITDSSFGSLNTGGIRVGDDNTITNSGSINTEGERADGIWAGDNNSVINRGAIKTEGKDAAGIVARDNNRVTNSGSINTRGANASGIRAGPLSLNRSTGYNYNNYIVNDGFIQTTGANASGIVVWGENNLVTNTGRIHTTGRGAAGLRAGNVNTGLVNVKTAIKVAGKVAKRDIIATIADLAETVGVGIVADLRERILRADNTWLLNNGEILTTGANAPGIQVSNKITVVHNVFGRIQVTGPGSAGVRAGDENLLILHGSISSARGRALVLGHNNNVIHSGRDTLRSMGQDTPAVVMGDGNTLTNTGTIEATGTGANAHGIAGGSNNTINNSGIISARGGKAVNLSGRGNTLNLLPGAALIGDMNLGPGGRVLVDTAPVNSVFWHGITARPKKRSEGAPFFYNARTRQLATYDIRALAASAQVLGDASGNVSGLMARPAPRPSGNTRSLIPTATGSAFWLRTFGNRARYRSRGDLHPEAGHLGLAAGYDLRLNATQFGVLAGYGRGELRFEGTQRFRPGPSLFKGPFAGVYVRRDFAPFSVQVGLSGGTLKHESSRLVNDNLAPSGQARAEARTRSWWLAPEARVGLRLDAGLMQFEPSFTARYARQSIRGFTETGIRAPATVGQRKVELLETRLELKTVREVGPGRIALKAGWQYRDDLKSNEAQVRLLGESQRVRLESGLGSSLYLGAEAEFELAPGLFLNLSGEAVSGSGYRNISGMASVYQAF